VRTSCRRGSALWDTARFGGPTWALACRSEQVRRLPGVSSARPWTRTTGVPSSRRCARVNRTSAREGDVDVCTIRPSWRDRRDPVGCWARRDCASSDRCARGALPVRRGAQDRRGAVRRSTLRSFVSSPYGCQKRRVTSWCDVRRRRSRGLSVANSAKDSILRLTTPRRHARHGDRTTYP